MVLVSPVTALAGPMVTYGLLVIATLAAAGVLAWRLGLAMGLGTVGSWVSGLLWASSPIVVHRTASGLYMLLLLAALLPAALILALRLMHGFSVRRAVVLGVFLGACLLTDLQVTAYILLAVGAVGLYAVTTKPVWRSRAALKRLAAVAAAFLVGGIPALAMVARAEAEGNYRTPTGARVASANTFSADLAQLLLPPCKPPVRRHIRTRGGGAGEPLELRDRQLGRSRLGDDCACCHRLGGNTTLQAHLVVGGRGRRLRGPGHRAKSQGLRACSHAAGGRRRREGLAGRTVDLAPRGAGGQRPPHPGALHAARCAPARAPRGSRGTGGRPPAADCRNGGGRGALCVGSRGGGRRAARRPSGGEQLARIIRDDRRPGIVVDVPLSWRSGIDLVGSPFISPRAMVQQAIHGKPIAAGYIARLDRSMLDRLTARPLYRSLLLPQGDGDIPAGLDSPNRNDVIADAERLRAHWIVVWPEADRRVLPYLRGSDTAGDWRRTAPCSTGDSRPEYALATSTWVQAVRATSGASRRTSSRPPRSHRRSVAPAGSRRQRGDKPRLQGSRPRSRTSRREARIESDQRVHGGLVEVTVEPHDRESFDRCIRQRVLEPACEELHLLVEQAVAVEVVRTVASDTASSG